MHAACQIPISVLQRDLDACTDLMAHAQSTTLCRHSWNVANPFSSRRPVQRRVNAQHSCRCTAQEGPQDLGRRDTLLSLAAAAGALCARPSFAEPAVVPGKLVAPIAI